MERALALVGQTPWLLAEVLAKKSLAGHHIVVTLAGRAPSRAQISQWSVSCVSELQPDGCRVRNRDNEKNIKVGIWSLQS